MSLHASEVRDEEQQIEDCRRGLAGQETNQFTRAVNALKYVSCNSGVPIAVVGAACAAHHGAASEGCVLEVVVPLSSSDEFLVEAQRLGFQLLQHCTTGRHVLQYHEQDTFVTVQVLPSRDAAPANVSNADGSTPAGSHGSNNTHQQPALLPHPSELGVSEGLGFATLTAWVTMELENCDDDSLIRLADTLTKVGDEEFAAIDKAVEQLSPHVQDNWQAVRDRATFGRKPMHLPPS
jgi:hypothetical protein